MSTLRCARCSTTIEIPAPTYDAGKPVLLAAGWLPCARKGGKVAGLCPACRPRGAPTSLPRSTP